MVDGRIPLVNLYIYDKQQREVFRLQKEIGHNFRVELNERVLGAIIENMDITAENIVFDNAYLVVYGKEYLPLVTAMAVMVTRELARDNSEM